MTTRADLIVVGAGLAGSATAWAASARGLDVVVLEAFGPGHKNGSSHGSARIFRRAYPDDLYVRLTGAAGERWRRLEDEAGETLLTLTGGVDFGATRDPELLHKVLTRNGVPAELLEPDAAAERWPYFDFKGVGQIMYHADSGVLDPRNAMAAMLRLAAANGADIRFGVPVTGLEATRAGDGAVAHTDSGDFAAPVIAVAAGAWIAPLLDGVVELPPLRVTQQHVFHFAPTAGPTAPTTATACPAAATAGYQAPSRSASTPPARRRPRPTATSPRTRPHEPGLPTSSAGGSPAWTPLRSTR
jgi:sarcosine oxidase